MKNRKKIIFTCWLFTCCFQLYAQRDDTFITQPPTVDTTIVTEDIYDEDDNGNLIYDTLLTTGVQARRFSADSINQYRMQKGFAYIHNLDSLLHAIQEEAAKKKSKQRHQPYRPINIGVVIKAILWLLAIAVVVFIIFKLFLGKDGLFAAPLRNKQIQIDEEEQIDVNNIDRQLADAVAKGNYRIAVRYLYLQTLTRLSDKGLIQLSPDKTNYQYVKELAKQEYKNDFAKLTVYYEYVWYGDFQINSEVFQSVKYDFDTLQKKIK